jgi:hypothetical protein
MHTVSAVAFDPGIVGMVPLRRPQQAECRGKGRSIECRLLQAGEFADASRIRLLAR